MFRSHLVRNASPLALAILLATSCGGTDQTPVAQTQNASMGPHARTQVTQSPSRVAEAFLEAVAADDQDRIEALLTPRSVEALHAEGSSSLSFSGKHLGTWTIDGESIEGAEASVPVTLENESGNQEIQLRLRRTSGAWRVFGASVEMGGGSFEMDFEGGENDMLGGMAQELAEGIAEGMEQAFQSAAAEWQAGGSAEEIARMHASFDALRPVDEPTSTLGWRVSVNAVGRRVADVVETLLGGSGIALAADERLDRVSNVSLSGVSRIQAIETLCAEAGVVPIYPDPMRIAIGEKAELTFRDGPRTLPVAFAGPFLIEVDEVDEDAPNTTGSFKISLRALGLDPGVLAANESMAEYLTLDEVSAPDGEELRPDPDAQWMGSPTIHRGYFEYSLSPDLRGLVRAVDSFDVIGTIHLERPDAVTAISFQSAEARASAHAGPWTATWTVAGTDNTIELACSEEGLADARVRFAPMNAAGEPMGILSEGTSFLSNRLRADLSVPETPSALTLKVFHTERMSFPFALASVPLAHHDEQPEAVVAVDFAGDSPCAITFLEFGDRSNPDFPHAKLRVVNHSNLAITEARASFEYLDANGRLLKEFPHSLSGEFSFEGPSLLADTGGENEVDTVAFFMPPETETIRVRLEGVTFANGTTWERD